MARIRIGDMLIRAKLIDEMQLNAALAQQRQWGGKLGDILVDQGFLDEMMLWLGLSKQLDVPLITLPDVSMTPDLLSLIPVEICEKLEIIPIARDDRTLTLATSDPNNIGALDEVAFRTGLKVKTVLAPHREVVWAIRCHYRGDRAPCPPPRLRRQMNQPEPPPPAAAAPSQPPQLVRQNQTPLNEVAMAASRPPNIPPFAFQPPASPSGSFSLPPQTSPGANAEEQLRQANEMLRVLVELCIQRGVFTREDLWNRLKR